MITLIIKFIKHINKKTEPKLFTPEALAVITDKDKSIELRSIIDDYHETGKWDYKRLNELGL